MIKANKLLGQHFLNNKKILGTMADAAEVSKSDVILEVGPGRGSLTEILAGRAKKVVAVEKDRNLVLHLREKFQNQKNVEILEGDILKLKTINQKLKTKNYKIVANIPYYITARFLRNFLEAKNKPSLMVLMVQYEVAKRICAKPPDMSLLALSVQAYGHPKFIRKVPRGAFSPVPEVDSAIIKISDISDDWFRKNKIQEKKFFELARTAFQQKRKMLRGSLKNLPIPEEYENKRPEELTLQNWAEILKL